MPIKLAVEILVSWSVVRLANCAEDKDLTCADVNAAIWSVVRV